MARVNPVNAEYLDALNSAVSESTIYSKQRWLKLWRYAKLYGLRRALVKAAGRTRSSGSFFFLPRKAAQANVSFIGCGQAAFATLAYFVARNHGRVFRQAYDLDTTQAQSLARFYDFQGIAPSAETLLSDPALKTVYIASNHASHAAYAAAALEKGLTVFVEKPICVQWEEWAVLGGLAARHQGRVFAGYNRPYAAATVQLVSYLRGCNRPVSMACYVHGHSLAPTHWYRQAEEGTRILGNAGHWIDYAVHIFSAAWGKLPQQVLVQHAAAHPTEPDDNFSLTIRTSAGDLFTLHAASRSEPFEGIHETIELQCGDLSAQILDFRRLRVWRGARRTTHRYWLKDVGHRRCALQPFLPPAEIRDWEEVMCSTRVALHVVDMLRTGTSEATFDLTVPPEVAAVSFGTA